jgi:hypothetical protein
MNGAYLYAKLFETGQYGRLYVVSGSHARGKTFHIYVLPKDVVAIPNGPNNGPINKDAIEVYGAVDGQRGWTETYGWLHHGPWQDDFFSIKAEKEKEYEDQLLQKALEKEAIEASKRESIEKILADYNA